MIPSDIFLIHFPSKFALEKNLEKIFSEDMKRKMKTFNSFSKFGKNILDKIIDSAGIIFYEYLLLFIAIKVN
jgi:hypothetical protein